MRGRKRYQRMIEVSFNLFDQLLNLPEGFEVEAVEIKDFEERVIFKVRCPSEEKFAVDCVGDLVPHVCAVLHYTNGIVDKFEWPDLGQEES